VERVFELKDENATGELAARLARALPRGSVLLLSGPLGAGKTTFVRYLARALGFTGRVTSPTYTLLHVYPTPEGPLLHADLYRLPEPGMAFNLGLFEGTEEARLTAVEWGRREDFPEAVEVVLKPVSETARRARVRGPEPLLRRL